MAHVCPHCEKSFVRPEHLRRHIRSLHEKDQSKFRCEECDKTFNRADSCRRHQLGHQRRDGSFVLPQTKRIRKACRQCATARAKCSGGYRCSRCVHQKLVCAYDERRGKTKPQNESGESGVDGLNETTENYAAELPASSSQHPGQEIPQPEGFTRPTLPVNAVEDLGMPYPNVDGPLPWIDNINWLPVAEDVDLSMFFDNDTEVAAPAFLTPAWESEQQSPRQSVVPSPGMSDVPSVSSKGSGTLYVDGYGGRQSMQSAVRRPRSSVSHIGLDDEVPSNVSFPERVTVWASGNSDRDLLTSETYHEIYNHFRRMCVHQFMPYKAFATSVFPSKQFFGHCLGLYVDFFQSLFPLIHVCTWKEQNTSWILCLAAAAVGSGYDTGSESLQTSFALCEFLRRAIAWQWEYSHDLDHLSHAQAAVLHCVVQSRCGLAGPEKESLRGLRGALEKYEAVVHAYNHDKIDDSQMVLKWQAWREQESGVRLRWFAWLLETIIPFMDVSPSYCSLPAQDIALPCEPHMWEAGDPETWASFMSSSSKAQMLSSAMSDLYVRHQCPLPLSGLPGTLLSYTILARTDEIARSIRQPLHTWDPRPAGNLGDDLQDVSVSTDASWLPADPTFAAWRNSACDCLDLLHWQATSQIALARGLESPFILHLHLARLLLLCPYRRFIALATRISKQAANSARELPMAAQLHGDILRWLTLDDHKGRLSLVHAGSIFWHLRRYSQGHFYEAFAAFLATLALWVYGVYLPQVRGTLMKIKDMQEQESGQSPSSPRTDNGSESEDSDLMPDNILLDRPCDDEIVQTFVRRGFKMRVDMSGAIDVCTTTSQRVVLKEGCKLLQQANTNRGRSYRIALQRLLLYI